MLSDKETPSKQVFSSDIRENVLCVPCRGGGEFFRTIADPRRFSLAKQSQAGAGNGGLGALYQPLSVTSQERLGL